jgi:hypothetical protein
MAKVGDRGGPKRTLGTLEEQAVGAEDVEDDLDMLQVLHLGRVVHQYVVEKDKHEPMEVWPGNVIQ